MKTALLIFVLALLLGGTSWLLRDAPQDRPARASPASTPEPVPPAPQPVTPPAAVPAPAAEPAGAEAADGPLDLPVGHGFSYRDLLTDVGARLDRVAERLADPMCQPDRHRYRPALRERCAAEDLVLIALLAARCRSLADTPLDAQAFLDPQQTARRATRAVCDDWGAELTALEPLGEALPAHADPAGVDRLRRASLLVRAAEQGVPLDVGAYGQLAVMEMQLRRRLQGPNGRSGSTRFSEQAYDDWLAEEQDVAEVIDAMIEEDAASGVAERVYFEMSRLPAGLAPQQLDFRLLDSDELSAARADRYREALTWYFAAERLHGESLRDSLYDYAGLARAENALHVNDVELARHLGYQRAADLQDGG